MSRIFELDKNPYGENISIYKRKKIEINPGVTVLVGCNGSGKTTLLKQIEYRCKKASIPVLRFDNLHDGGSNARSKKAFENNFEFVAALMNSSEGENIVMNIGEQAAKIGHFVKTGKNRDFRSFFDFEMEENKTEIPKERWILLDAVDSGLSIDNVIDIKEHLFKTVLEHNFGNEIYIIVSANSYEMCIGEQCFDVRSGRYRTFKSYNSYKNFILKSKEDLNKRYSDQLVNDLKEKEEKAKVEDWIDADELEKELDV